MTKPWTADDLNVWHRAQATNERYLVIPKLRCADGYEVSIQASEGHYCEPRASHAWPYQRFELGFPTVADEDIMEYAEEPARPTNTVYGFVPVAAVLLVITKHGGPDKEARALVDKVSIASHPCDVIE